MTKKFTILALLAAFAPGMALSATCSKINLTRCLDSACAINLSSNPAARCQYCGTADAGEPATSGMRSVTAGAASKNTISAKELKKAPTDPGERYIWATNLCLDKIKNCTAEDVAEHYDPLIEQSCTAAGIASNMSSLQQKAATNNKTKTSCTNEITTCIIGDSKCGADYSKCQTNELFNQFFAACSAQSTGCTGFTDDARASIAENRENVLSAKASNLTSIVASHIRKRMDKINSINNGCKNDADYNKCVETVCQNNTNDNCASDKTIANALCEFHKTACNKVKNLSTQEMQKDLDKLMQEARTELNL